MPQFASVLIPPKRFPYGPVSEQFREASELLTRWLASKRFEEFGNPASVGGRFGICCGALENLLDMDLHLSEEGRCDGVTIAFMGQDGHA